MEEKTLKDKSNLHHKIHEKELILRKVILVKWKWEKIETLYMVYIKKIDQIMKLVQCSLIQKIISW